MVRILGAVLLVVATAVPARAQMDSLNLAQAEVWNSPVDVASWPVTHSISAIRFDPVAGISITSDALDVWPDYWPPGWDGPLQYTVWAVVNVNGKWYTSGFIQMWRNRGATGAPMLQVPPTCDFGSPNVYGYNNFRCNWAYDARWGPMFGHLPVAGELMGFFITPGNARGEKNVTSLRERTNVVLVPLPPNDTGYFTFSGTTSAYAMGDADGDGKSELAVFRPSNGTWYIRASSTNYANSTSAQWGLPGDIPVVGDFDGDHHADLTVYRPSTGEWFSRLSTLGYSATTFWHVQWGLPGDIPVSGDFDGDGITDLTVFRPMTGEWFSRLSSLGFSGTTFWHVQWGLLGDIPVAADFDGDGRTDLVVFRPATGEWFSRLSSLGFSATTYWYVQWGLRGDIPVAADFDGDHHTDLVVYRPSTGQWYARLSTLSYSATTYFSLQWGLLGDVPVVADFDGDGATDMTVFRPSTGEWYIRYSSRGFSTANGWYQWGLIGDVLPTR